MSNEETETTQNEKQEEAKQGLKERILNNKDLWKHWKFTYSFAGVMLAVGFLFGFAFGKE